MSVCDKITPSEKTALIMQLTEEADYTRALMEDARQKGQHNRMRQLEDELQGQDNYIQAIQDDCA